MEAKQLEQLCRLGEKADTLLREGRTREALQTYNEITTRLEKEGHVDSYIVAKVTLGTLRCFVKLGDFKNAFEIWNTDLEAGLHGIGIYALESAQTTVHDMITYDMLCAYLHTLTDTPKRETAATVNQYLSRVCEQATEDGDRATLRLALGNWKQHLRETFQGTIPHEYAVPLIRFEKSLGETVKTQPIDFPLPSPWEKPHDFHEMSHVARLDTLHTGKVDKNVRRRRAS